MVVNKRWPGIFEDLLKIANFEVIQAASVLEELLFEFFADT